MSQSLRIVITGGSGRVGRFLVREFLQRGHQVVSVDQKAAVDNFGERFVECDVRQRDRIQPILAEADAVCHLGEIPHALFDLPREEIYSSNTRGGATVLQTAADLKLRHAVYASTCQVYGFWGQPAVPPPYLPIDEDCPLRPSNVYSVSKAANEMYARYVAKNHGLSVSIFRFPGVLTADPDPMRLKGIETDDGPLRDGFNTVVHASDLARAFAMAVELARPGVETYNFSAHDIISMVPLRTRLEKNHPNVPHLPPGWPDRKSPIVIDKARIILGWEPRWSFQDYYQQTRGREAK